MDGLEPHRVLASPELLLTIFELADLKTRTNGARTCLAWSSPALDSLWTSLTSIVPLLELLAPLIRDDRAYMATIEIPDNVDWVRFFGYARRVRSLTSTETAKVDGRGPYPLSVSIFKDIAFFLPVGQVVLPNIRYLRWTVNASYHSPSTVLAVLPLISPTVETVHLNLKFTNEYDSGLVTLLGHLKGRLSNTSSITLDGLLPVDALPCLVACIPSMPRLRAVQLALSHLSPAVLEALGHLPLLQSFTTRRSAVYRGEGEGEGWRLEVQTHWFANFTGVDIHASLADFSNLLLATPRPLLREVGVTARRFEGQAELRTFCEGVTSSCPFVTSLKLNFLPRNKRHIESIQFESLRPLLKCAEVTALRIGHDRPLELVESHVVEMGKAWKAMKVLHLSADPTTTDIASPERFSIAVLSTIAEAFPDLTQLGLFFSDTPAPDLGDEEGIPYQLVNLTSLEVGASSIPNDDTGSTACFIEVICPSARITAKIPRWRSDDDAPSHNLVGPYYQEWSEVDNFAGILARSKQQARRTIGALKNEIAELKRGRVDESD